MKRIQMIVGILLLLTGIACTEDKGNYDYTPLNELTFEGLGNSYQVEVDSILSIPVTITGNMDFSTDDYDYLWYAYSQTDKDGVTPPDTLSYEKDLNVAISLGVGEYYLRYVVTDKETGVYYSTWTYLSVINSYSKGVVALSRIENSDSDLTFINVLDKVTKHVYMTANGESAGKNPRGIFYLGGSDGMKNVLLVSTEEQAMTIEPSDFTIYRSLAQWFFVAPEGVVEGMATDGWYEYLIIDGKAYKRYVYPVANPSGMYDPQVAGDYDLAPFSLYGDGGFFYDKTRRCFLYHPGYGEMIVPTPLGDAFNAADMQMDMLYGVAYGENVRAVMEDDNGIRYMISALEIATYDPDTYDDIIQINARVKLEMTQQGATEATCFAISSKDPDFLYYAYGNTIVCVGMATGNVLAEYTLPQNVDYMEFNNVDNPERLYVAVSDGSETTDSGSIYFLKMASDGTLTEDTHFDNVCGKVVDFEYKP